MRCEREDALIAEAVACDRCGRDLSEQIKALKAERNEARAEVERLRNAKHTNACVRQSAYNVACVCGADEAQRDLLRSVAERQREACVRAALAWSRSQAEVAKDKERDSVMASAEMHMEESIMAKRIAAAIQRAPLVTEQP